MTSQMAGPHQRSSSSRPAGSLTRSVALVGGITLISRVLGLVREGLIAATWGASTLTDSFFIAFRIPDILYNSLLAFLVSTCFLPVFTSCLSISEEEAAAFFSSAVRVICGLLGGLTIALMWNAERSISLLAPGLSPDATATTASLTRIMTPIVFLGGVIGLGKSVMTARSQVLMPALLPVVFNVVTIACVLGLAASLGIHALAWGILLAAVFQVALVLPAFAGFGLWHRVRMPIAVHSVRRMLRLAGPVILALVLGQMMSFFELYLASASASAVSFLGYGFRLFSVPEQIFTVAVSTVLFPAFSSDAAAGRMDGLSDKLGAGLRATVFFVAPVSALLIGCSEEVVRLLLGRGQFTPDDAVQTALALAIYAFGLLPVCLRSLVTFVLFALERTRLLMFWSVAMIVVNIALDLALLERFSWPGIALGAAFTMWLHTGALLFVLGSSVQIDKRFRSTFVKVTICALATGIAVFALKQWVGPWMEDRGSLGTLLRLVSFSIAGTTIYFTLARLAAVDEALRWQSALSKRISGSA